jgi:hydroxymethylpyrimidine/phosphomethylpyrimidine kinase
MRPIVLTIAGSDPSGGAGIQGDIKAIEASGAYAVSAVTAVTAQNTLGIARSTTLDSDWVAAQLAAVLSDIPVGAVKSGMLGDAAVAGAVADALGEARPVHYVCDPVMFSSSGHTLLAAAGVEVLIDRLLPLVTLLTPNVAEAEALSGLPIKSIDDAKEAGRKLLSLGPRAVLITGGHLERDAATDLLVRRSGTELFHGKHLKASNTHGTGCVFSASVAAYLARGRPLEGAIRAAKELVSAAIRHGLSLGRGTGPTDPLYFLHRDPPAGARRNADECEE